MEDDPDKLLMVGAGVIEILVVGPLVVDAAELCLDAVGLLMVGAEEPVGRGDAELVGLAVRDGQGVMMPGEADVADG